MDNKDTENIKSDNSNSYRKVNSTIQSNSYFSKNVFIPFLSGVLGSTLIIGTCFGIPSIKNKIINNYTNNITQTSSQNSSNSIGSNLVSISNYSDTAINVANKVLPSIVGIKVEYTVNSVFSRQSSAVAEGSGIIISSDGYILTNNHIVNTSSDSSYQVSEANKVVVYLYNDSTEYEAKIVGTDSQTDLAVIKIDKSNLTPAELGDSDSVKVGEFSMAIGNPLGMQSSVTSGIISAVNRDVTDSEGKKYKLIQTDTAINSGNSGGALVNSVGKVIGINTLKLSGTGIEGMGFAIPINSTKEIYNQLIQYSKVKRPYIGISGIDLNEKTAKNNNLVKGIYIKSIENFSAAEKASLKVGDVIIAANGKNISTMNELNEIKNSAKIGDELTLKINRNNSEIDVKLTLQEQP